MVVDAYGPLPSDNSYPKSKTIPPYYPASLHYTRDTMMAKTHDLGSLLGN